jgi:hypothetical protein
MPRKGGDESGLKKVAKTPARRPAETATPIVMAVALLIGKALDADAETVGYIAIVVAFVPAAVTWIVELARG